MAKSLAVIDKLLADIENANEESKSNNENNTVQSLIDNWVKMWNSYNLSMVNNLFANDATYFSSEKQGLIKGGDNIYQHHIGFGFVENGKSSTNKLWLNNKLETQVYGSTAIVNSLWYFSKGNVSTNIQKGRVTIM
eukprot:308294_1